MYKKTQEIIKYLKNHGGLARFSSLLKAGFHPDTLVTVEKEGKITRITRGIYQLVNYDIGPYPDFVIASLLAKKGVICLLSALAFHEATNEIPHSVYMAIPQGAHANRIKYPPVKFYRFSIKAWQAGIEEQEIGAHKIKVYSLAKTIADCFKFRNKIGIDVAREALKVAVTEKHIKPKEIMYYAKICRVDNIVKPILESVL